MSSLEILAVHGDRILVVCLWVLLLLRLARASGPAQASRVDAAVLFCGALALRIALACGFSRGPLFDRPLVDSAFYEAWARALAGGHDPYPVFGVDPLYPYVLGGLYRLFGVSSWVPALLGCLTGSLSVLLAHRVASRIASRPAAFLAGAALALYGPALYLDLLRLKSSLALCLTLASIESFLREDGSPSRGGLAATGALVGLASLNGSQSLVLAAIFALWLCARERPWARIAVLGLGVALTVTPSFVHNRVVGGQSVVFHSGGGMILWASNNPAAWGRLTPLPGIRQDSRYEVADYTALASRELGRPVTESEATAHFRGRALRFLAGDPVHAARLVVAKVGLLLNDYEWPDNYDFEVMGLLLPALALPLPAWGLVVPFGLLGLTLAPVAGRGPRLLAACVVALAVPLLVMYSNDRLRFQLLGPLFPLAALAADAIVRSPRPRATGLGACVAILALLLHLPTPRVGPTPSLFNVADAYLRAGRVAEAARLLDLGLALDPWHVGSLVNRAGIHSALGDHARAAGLLERAVALRPREGAILYNLGNACRRSGRPADAVAAYQRARPLLPGDPQLDLKLGLALSETGRPREAATLLEPALKALGEGRTRTLPTSVLERAEGHDRLASIHAQAGDRDRAAREGERCKELLRQAVGP